MKQNINNTTIHNYNYNCSKIIIYERKNGLAKTKLET